MESSKGNKNLEKKKKTRQEDEYKESLTEHAETMEFSSFEYFTILPLPHFLFGSFFVFFSFIIPKESSIEVASSSKKKQLTLLARRVCRIESHFYIGKEREMEREMMIGMF